MQRPWTEAQGRRSDLDVALHVSVMPKTVLDRNRRLGRDRPFLVASGGRHAVSIEAFSLEEFGNMAAADDLQLVLMGQFFRTLSVPQSAFADRDSCFVPGRIEDSNAFDFDAEGEVEWIIHACGGKKKGGGVYDR